jgi:hypothetical protein
MGGLKIPYSHAIKVKAITFYKLRESLFFTITWLEV